jgi:hypothetical protein
MASLHHRWRFILAIALGAAAFATVTAPPASAQSYSDVPGSHWAHGAIDSVTDRGPSGHKILDDYGRAFKPEIPLTRALFARSLVIAAGQLGEDVDPVAIKDVSQDSPYYHVIQVAVHHGYLTPDKEGRFKPDDPVLANKAEVAIVRWLRERHRSYSWTLLTSLRTNRWEPNPGWKTGAPSYLPYVVASRQLLLRFNHPDSADGQEVTPLQPIDRAEVAYMLWRAFKQQDEYGLWGLAGFKTVTFPPLSDRQKQIARFALKYVGYPYIWGGEYPTENSPYGHQGCGGFDCSGFVFYVMKMHFGYPITVNERGGHDMAARAKPRITRKQLTCGDLIFFGPNGPKSGVESIYHAALYLGNGWFIHSTGSSDGVTLASLDGSTYWKTYFAWGRRLLKPAELVVAPAATPAADAVAAPSSSPAAD